MITSLAPQIQGAGVHHASFVPTAMEHTETGRRLVRTLSKDIANNSIESDQQLSAVAGLGNLLRSVAQRLMVSTRLKQLIYRVENFNRDLQVKSIDRNRASKAIGSESRCDTLIELKWRCGADSMLIDQGKLLNEGIIWVRAIADSCIRDTANIFQGDSFVSPLFQCSDYAKPVTVNCMFNSRDIPGLGKLIANLKGKLDRPAYPLS